MTRYPKWKADYSEAEWILRKHNQPLKLNPEIAERAAQKAEARRLRRDREIPRDRVCPRCKRTVLESCRWRVASVRSERDMHERGLEVVCLSCARMEFISEAHIDEDFEWDEDAIETVSMRWRLARGMMSAGTARALIEEHGWLPPRVSKVKIGDLRVGYEDKQLLDSLQPGLRWSQESRVRDANRQIRRLRLHVGVARGALAAHLGWRTKRLEKYERGATMRGKDMQDILAGIVRMTKV